MVEENLESRFIYIRNLMDLEIFNISDIQELVVSTTKFNDYGKDQIKQLASKFKLDE